MILITILQNKWLHKPNRSLMTTIIVMTNILNKVISDMSCIWLWVMVVPIITVCSSLTLVIVELLIDAKLQV